MAKVYDAATDLITFARLQAQNTTSGSSYLGSDGLLKFAAEDEPRIEYAADGSLKGLLIEEQRTNLVTYSEDFSNAAWSKFNSIAVSPSAETAPNGQEVAYELTGIESGDGDTGLDEAVSASASTTYTGTIWFKAKSASDVGKYVRLRLKRIGGTFVEQNESVQLTNNWVRHEITLTLLSDNTGISLIITKDTTQNIVDRADECLIYGAQLEAGSFPTSYIPTSGSQSTRSPDIASIPVSAFGYNQDAGTVVVEASFNSRSDGQTFHRTVELSNGSSSRLAMFDDANQSNEYIRYFVRDDTGSNVFGAANLSGSDQSEVNLAIAYAADDMAIYGGNGQSATGSSGQMGADVDTLNIGKEGNNTSFLNGHIKSIQYFPRRLTNAQLQELTS